jgi:hypothetical protein
MQTFSQRSKNDPSKNDVWYVERLHQLSQDLPSQMWRIPPSFLEGWSWGEDHIADHLGGCLDADLSRPILIWDGEIVDGCHRVCKALSQGDTHIQAIDLSTFKPYPDLQETAQDSGGVRWSFKDVVSILRALKSREYDFRHPLDI